MTDTLRSATTLNGTDVKPISLAGAVHPVADYPRFGLAQQESVAEDDGLISCPCGYNEDDGSTVACDECNKWQHVRCYYPEYADDQLPEDMQHWCIDCRPRPFDRQAAHARQREARGHQISQQNGVKQRQVTKSHKKKNKDTVSGHANGWPLDKSRHDRTSASPRDLPPPSKRPKTSHRSSNSTANATNAAVSIQARKRNGSIVNHRRSLSRSPDNPSLPYSDEFVRMYREDNFTVPDANCLSSLNLSSTMAQWLSQPEDVSRITNGIQMHEIFQKYDGPDDVLAGQAPIDVHDAQDPTVIASDGKPPMWKFATVREPLSAQACIGELRGHVGFKDDYKADPANRWSTLRHPEPFVFFHPQLPIFIDTRQEGTVLRYVRRSCHPNAELKILITDVHDYHFCFIANRDIEAGEEIAVAWDTNNFMPKVQNNALSEKEMDSLSRWTSIVLANCGPCACQSEHCLLLRMRMRTKNDNHVKETVPVKAKTGKKRKAGNHLSPLNTLALNSRSNSEARKIDADDEPTDSRSTSGSGRDSASRDMTPNTHYSGNGTLMPELSERERKKLAKEEEMFRRQEEEATGKQTKKKRHSGNGSNLNTPSSTTSKQLGLPTSSRYADTGTSSKPRDLPSAKSSTGRRPKVPKPQARPIVHVPRTRKSTYVDADVQCDMDDDDLTKRKASPPTRKPFQSMTHRLLQRCAVKNALYKEQSQRRAVALTPPEPCAREVEKSTLTKGEPQLDQSPGMDAERLPEPVLATQSSDDVDMADAPHDGDSRRAASSEPAAESPATARENTKLSNSPAPVHPPMDPPPPPWPTKASGSSPFQPKEKDEAGDRHRRPTDLHISMPPPPGDSFTTAQSSHLQPTETPTIITPGATVASPAGLAAMPDKPPLFSPSVAAAVAGVPAKKKMSLSDYTRRSKAKDKDDTGRGDRESSPALSTASAGAPTGPVSATTPVVPPLKASESEIEKTKAAGSAIATEGEDVQMEDALPAMPTTAAPPTTGEAPLPSS